MQHSIYTYEDPTSLSFFNISPFTIECIDFSLISINANTRWTDSEQEMIILKKNKKNVISEKTFY